ncbi:antibiotic biosynthesis monooxygenase family protein [Streptomyces chattanoogensis]|uniref:antibiotic biosynthesis monooxygenase family protein n=1 Tax=Streptomyces chattanoogensis TaxID=66876 RepID=UPI0036ACE7FB
MNETTDPPRPLPGANFPDLPGLPELPRFPDFRRPDAATALVSSWILPDPGLARPAAEAILDGWEHQSRPEAMLSLSVFLSADGGHLLNYAQWTSDDAHRAWVRTRRPAVIGRIDEALPGIRRPGLVRYRRHRSYVPERTDEPVGRRPALLVTPAFATTGPGVQRALADTLADELARAEVPGLLGAHLHLSQDGGRVLNVAEWDGLPAWEAFVASEASARLRAAVAAMDGVTVAPAVPDAPRMPGEPGVTHYRLHRSLVNVPAGEAHTVRK